MPTLKELRQAKKLRISDVAEYMGVSPRTVKFWESSQRTISVYDLERLLAFYGVDMPISKISELLPKKLSE